MMAHGGLGDFLFQLDLAKRFEAVGIETLFLVRKNYDFLSDIISSSDVSKVNLIRSDGIRYLSSVFYVWIISLLTKVAIVNSFHYSHLRLPTRIFYKIAKLFSAEVVVCQKSKNKSIPYKQITYLDRELIWQRNNRIISCVAGQDSNLDFPILKFEKGDSFSNKDYIHIHPVASSLEKSYPPEKLLSALNKITDKQVLMTITPHAKWYQGEKFEKLASERTGLDFVNKNFSFKEICGYISGAKVFCTVNTGLLWTAIMLGQKVVVCDTDTDYEWNPAPYGAIRLREPEPEELVKILNV